jgi:hypothetical protein
MSDVSNDDTHVIPTLEECTDEYDDTVVSVPFRSGAFSSSLTPGRDMSQLWVIDSARSINLTFFRTDFVSFDPPSVTSRVGGVGVDVKCSSTIQIIISVVYNQSIRHTVYALYTLDLLSRSSQRIGRLLSVSWMKTHNGCEFTFPLALTLACSWCQHEWVC